MTPKDWTGNSVAFAKTIGASNHAAHDREEHDYYATEPKATEWILKLETFDKNIWECACGEGHISKVLQQHGYNVKSSDLIDRGFGDVHDFLSVCTPKFDGDIITNPPYKYVSDFILMALRTTKSKVAFFMPTRYLEGKKRKEIFRTHPPIRIWVSSSRLKCAINGKFDEMQGSAVSYSWFVWQVGFKGKTEIDWFN